jgi:hypothetical protein
MPPRKDAQPSDAFGQRLALNLWDLDRVAPDLMERLGPQLDLGRDSVVRVGTAKDREDRFADTAVPFRCDLLSAAMICDVLRATDRKFNDAPTRIYLLRDGKWRRLVGDAVLSVVDGGKVQLNPAIFKVRL